MSDKILKRLYTTENMREPLYAADLIVYESPKETMAPKYIMFQPNSRTYSAMFTDSETTRNLIIGSYREYADTILCLPQFALLGGRVNKYLNFWELDSLWDYQSDTIQQSYLRTDELLIPLTKTPDITQPEVYLRIK